MKLGLIGGTFNPIHLGHLIISEYLRETFPLDRIIFIPSGNPPHKSSIDMASSEHRKEMVEIATKSNPNFLVSSIETDRLGKSYTVDTMREFKTQYPDDQLYFIIGADSLFELDCWKDFKTLATITTFLLSSRPGLDEEEIYNKINQLKYEYDANIIYIKVPLVDISSTSIRERARKHQSLKYLVTDGVEEYIKSNHLYLWEDRHEYLDNK